MALPTSPRNLGNGSEGDLLDWFAEVPWGIFAYLFIVVLGGAALIWNWKGLTMGEYIAGISAGAGLLGIGHGIRTGARHFSDGGRQRAGTREA